MNMTKGYFKNTLSKQNRLKIFFKYFFGFAIALSIGMYFRLYPLFYFASSDAYEKASVLIVSKLRTAVTNQLTKQFPNLTGPQKNKLIAEGLNHIIHTKSKTV